MTTKELDDLAELDAKASPAPWELRKVDGLAAICCPTGWIFENGDRQEAIDQKIAVAARNALPGLIADYRRLLRVAKALANEDVTATAMMAAQARVDGMMAQDAGYRDALNAMSEAGDRDRLAGEETAAALADVADLLEDAK